MGMRWDLMPYGADEILLWIDNCYPRNKIVWCLCSQSEVLWYDLVKVFSYACPISPKFDRRLRSGATKAPVKFRSDTTI